VAAERGGELGEDLQQESHLVVVRCADRSCL